MPKYRLHLNAPQTVDIIVGKQIQTISDVSVIPAPTVLALHVYRPCLKYRWREGRHYHNDDRFIGLTSFFCYQVKSIWPSDRVSRCWPTAAGGGYRPARAGAVPDNEPTAVGIRCFFFLTTRLG